MLTKPSQQLTFKHFLLKAQVLSLYRQAIRASQSIPDPVSRRETILWIRTEFERNKHLRDTALIQDRLASGRRELRQYLPIVSTP